MFSATTTAENNPLRFATIKKKKKTQSKQIRGGDTNTSTCNNNPGSGKRYKLRAQAFSFFKRAHSLLIYPLE